MKESLARSLSSQLNMSLTRKRSGLTLIKIIEEECEKRRISRKELESGSRRSKVSQARAQIARRGIKGLPAAEVARHLGVTTSSITRAVEKLDDLS